MELKKLCRTPVNYIVKMKKFASFIKISDKATFPKSFAQLVVQGHLFATKIPTCLHMPSMSSMFFLCLIDAWFFKKYNISLGTLVKKFKE